VSPFQADGQSAALRRLSRLTGTYTYPISFAVPANAPPTIHAPYGSVAWRLKAQVHRPGAFTSKLTASKYVTLVACPGEEDMEDQDSIVVERQWDSQLQYLITVSGRTFFIGGKMPVHITLMPLTKVKVHRISVFLDGKGHPRCLPTSR
jgi:arrestin-related trafficking adapter 3/6